MSTTARQLPLPMPDVPQGIDATDRRLKGATVRAGIDRSCAAPCLVFFASSVFWLLAGTFLAMLASIKMHNPEFLADFAALTFGRVRAAHLNAVAFGWASMAGIGVILWLMCRLCRVRLQWPRLLVTAALIWNVGVLAGIIGILAGYSTGLEWLEMPPYAAFMLFVAFGILSIWAVSTFSQRAAGHVYVSQWYLFGAVFWFPWLYATVQILLVLEPTSGVTQAAINWWFGHNVLGLWFTPIALAAAYYLIPKVTGKPIHSYYLSIFGFWTLAAFYNWAGVHHLISGPIPAWLVSVSVVGSVMMVIPVVTVAVNHHMTMRGQFGLLKYSPTLRFVVFGAMSYTLVSLQGSMMSVHAVNEPLHFTHHTIGHAHLGLYAFYTMLMFGAIYYIVPRLTGREWASSGLIRAHFWFTAIGILLMIAALMLGGLVQGLEMNQASDSLANLVGEHGLFEGIGQFIGGLQQQNGAVPFMDIVEGQIPYLVARSFSGILLLMGHLAFAVLMVRNAARLAEEPPRSDALPRLRQDLLRAHGRRQEPGDARHRRFDG